VSNPGKNDCSLASANDCDDAAIEGNVSHAVAQALWSGPLLQRPYPGRWAHLKKEFVTRLLPVIERVLRANKPL
jgi:hypothetical protein